MKACFILKELPGDLEEVAVNTNSLSFLWLTAKCLVAKSFPVS